MNPPPSPTHIGRYLDALDMLNHRARQLYQQWHQHILEQAHNLDGYPSGAGDGTGRRGTSELTTVERHTDLRLTLEQDSLYVPETIRAAQQNLADAIDTMTRDLGLRTPAAEAPQMRCNGRIDPTCTNVPSDHHDTTGTTITGMCDDCWIKACPRCHSRPTAQYRQTCDPCRMQIARSHTPAA